MIFTAALVALVGATAVSGQVPEYESALDIELVPSSVDPSVLPTWCQGQRNTCRILCVDGTETNDCTATQTELSYECLCTSNSSAPGLEYYTQTMPTYICQEAFRQCIDANVGNAEGQDDCTNNIGSLCAEQEPPVPEDEEDEDEGNDEETPSETETEAPSTATAEPTTSPTDGDAEEELETTTSDGFAAPTMAPAGNGVAAAAALGLLAYLV